MVWSVKKIKVLVADTPAMLYDIVGSLIREQEDMDLTSPSSSAGLEVDLVEQCPDVLLITCDRDRLADASRPFFNHLPRLRVLALASSGNDAALCELQPRVIPKGIMSPESLLRTIREVMGRRTPVTKRTYAHE